MSVASDHHAAEVQEVIRKAIGRERDAISAEARRIAALYPQASDGRNTFILLADWIDARNTTHQ